MDACPLWTFRHSFVDALTEHGLYLQVNGAFRDAILSSLIQHKLDLHDVPGLEHNSAAGIDLTESRKALRKYPELWCAVPDRREDGGRPTSPGQIRGRKGHRQRIRDLEG